MIPRVLNWIIQAKNFANKVKYLHETLSVFLPAFKSPSSCWAAFFCEMKSFAS